MFHFVNVGETFEIILQRVYKTHQIFMNLNGKLDFGVSISYMEVEGFFLFIYLVFLIVITVNLKY